MWLLNKGKVSNIHKGNIATAQTDINEGAISCQDNYLPVEGSSSDSNFVNIHPKRRFHGNFLLVYGVTCMILSRMSLHGVRRICSGRKMEKQWSQIFVLTDFRFSALKPCQSCVRTVHISTTNPASERR